MSANSSPHSGFNRLFVMIADLKTIKPINEVPFTALMRRMGTRPALLTFLMPDMDLVIWQMRPCVQDACDMELRQSALRALDHAIEDQSGPGAAIYEFDGFSFFAFRSVYRDEVLTELGITDLLP